MTTQSDRRGSSESGFALLEAVAVLLLASLVLVTLLLASDLVTRNAGAAARRANQVEGLATGLAALRQDIENAKLVRVGVGAGLLLFQGRAGSLGLAVGRDRSDLGQGDALVWIEARSEGGQNVLVRSSAPLRPITESFGGASFANPAILIEGQWTYRFSYAQAGASGLSWSSSWSNSQKLPAAIKLEIFDSAGLSPALPPLIAEVHVNAEAICPDYNLPPCEDSESEGPVFEEENNETDE